MDDFREQVKKSFLACKTDINTINSENQELKKKLKLLEEKNKLLENNLNETNSKLLELTAQFKGLEIALNYIKEIKTPNQTTIEPQIQNEISPHANNIEIKKEKLPIENKDPYEALLAFKAKVNKREILKQKILSMIGENGLNLSELKFLFVEHYKYCSKATFYNYLKELEYEKLVITRKEQHKTYVYLLNSLKNEI